VYTPPAFREEDPEALRAMMRAVRLATLVTATAEGLVATPLPLFLREDEGDRGTLYGHVARANPQWRLAPSPEALAIFSGPDAYITPSWYAAKAEHGPGVPTWNYAAVHVYGPVAFFDDPALLREIVSRLTDLHEGERSTPWSVGDAPEPFVAAQLKGIVGVRLPISRIEGKRKMSQNRPDADRAGVIAGLGESERPLDRAVAEMIRRDPV
jgi:transcriptional regulator